MKTLKKGAKGTEVEILQHLLIYRGANISADGDFGSGTEKAVINFQSSNFDDKGHSLTPDGIVGFATWRSLVESENLPKTVATVPPDKVTIRRIKKIHPSLQEELGEIYDEIRNRGVGVRFAQVLRTFEEQDALYAKGRTVPGKIVTNARGGQSYHNYGLAVDIVLLTTGGGVSWNRELDLDGDHVKDWDEIVFVFKHYGWKWGGDWRSFKDYPHFQKTFNRSTAELKKRYDSGDFGAKPYVRLT